MRSASQSPENMQGDQNQGGMSSRLGKFQLLPWISHSAEWKGSSVLDPKQPSSQQVRLQPDSAADLLSPGRRRKACIYEGEQHPNPWSMPGAHLTEVQALRAHGHSFLPFEAFTALAGEGGTDFLLEEKVEGRGGVGITLQTGQGMNDRGNGAPLCLSHWSQPPPAVHPSLYLPYRVGVNETLTFLLGARGVGTSLSSGTIRWSRPGSRAGVPREVL